MNETWWVDIAQLDDEQKTILAATPDSSLLIIGPPGSGKTNILMLRAKYVKPIGPRVAFLTFTRSLSEFLRSGPNVGRGDQIQSEEITTFMSWARTLVKSNGGKVPDDTGDFDHTRDQTIATLEEIVEEHNLGQVFDTIFVDEVQDFSRRELAVIKRLSYRVNFAGDSRQRIWKGEGLLEASRMVEETVELVRHYRIGERICEYADQILPPKSDQASLIEGCNYKESLRPSSVTPISSNSNEEMVRKCLDEVKEQLRYVTQEPIGVIGPRNEALDNFMALAEADELLQGITVRQKSNDYHPYNDNSRVRVMTVHAAKGSEFRAVHILGGEAFKSYNRELAFTGVTRAKTEVKVYHVAPLLGHMLPASGKLTSDLSSLF